MKICRPLLQIAAALAVTQLMLLTPEALSAAELCKPDQCIRVGSYNIRLFATDGAKAKTPADFDRLANRIAGSDQANLDVVVLQEINKDGKEWNGADGLRARLEKLGYKAIEGSFGGENRQFVILLYRTKAISLVAGGTDLKDIPTTFHVASCKYENLRPPVTAVLKSNTGAFTFHIIGVHLKSQKEVAGDTTQKKTCDDTIRAFQSEKIATHVAKLKAENANANVILVGDFNAKFGAPEYGVLRAAGYRTLIEGDCSAAKVEQCSYIFAQDPDLIDHVVVHSSLKQAVKGSGTIGKTDAPNYWNTQSDHVPVWASFRIDM